MDRYEWVTDEMFQSKLEEIVAHMNTGELLAVPGIYEALSEALNNDVLDALTEERELEAQED